MGKLLKFEFRKLFRQKSFYICGAVLVGLILLSAFTMNMLMQLSDGMMESGGVSIGVDESLSFSGLYMMATSLGGSDLSIVLAIFIALFVCGDYVNGTLKNVIAKGYGRVTIYASKYIVSVIAAFVLSFLCLVSGFLSGTAFWGVGDISTLGGVGNYISVILLQLLGVIAYTSVFFLISVLLKKTGGSIAVGIVGPLVITMIISLIDTATSKKSFELADYWIDNCFSDIARTSVESDLMIRCLVCFIIYTVVCTVGAHLIGRKNEV